jgi:hypothetical protein
MKHLVKWALLAFMILLFSSCKKDEPAPVPVKADYLGTVTVTFRGEGVDTDKIEVNFTPSADGKTADILIKKIKFVPQMPVTLDITIPGVTLTAKNNGFELSGDGLVPLAMGGEFPQYTVSGLYGLVAGDKISFLLKFGDYPTKYTGTKL